MYMRSFYVDVGRYELLGHELTVPKAFSCLALFNVMYRAINMLPMSIEKLAECKVALERLDQVSCARQSRRHCHTWNDSDNDDDNGDDDDDDEDCVLPYISLWL